MKLLLRFVGWSTLLAYPCWLLSPAYQRGVAAATTQVAAFFGQQFKVDVVRIFAPMDLGLFVAMCLASYAAPFRLRARSVALGLPAVAALEVLTVFLGAATTWAMRDQPSARRSAEFLLGYAIDGIVWVNPFLVWMVLLGHRQLPAGAAMAPGAMVPSMSTQRRRRESQDLRRNAGKRYSG